MELINDATEDLTTQLQQLPNVQSLEVNKNIVIISFNQSANNVVNVALALQANQQTYLKLYSQQPSLSDVFLAFTGKDLRD